MIDNAMYTKKILYIYVKLEHVYRPCGASQSLQPILNVVSTMAIDKAIWDNFELQAFLIPHLTASDNRLGKKGSGAYGFAKKVCSYAMLTIRGIGSLECAVKLLIIVLTKYNYTVDLNVASGISIYIG